MNKLRGASNRLKEIYIITKILKIEYNQFDFHKPTKLIKLVFKIILLNFSAYLLRKNDIISKKIRSYKILFR
jgi:hypothetical protein